MQLVNLNTYDHDGFGIVDQHCQEEGRPFTLSKQDVKANIKFPILWNQKQCLCCFKETKNYDSYNNIIQMVMVTAIRLLQNFGDEEKILSCENFSKNRCLFYHCVVPYRVGLVD